MNLQPQLKKISIPPPCIALAFVVVTALIVAPPLLEEGTQYREEPPDATVSGYFGRMFHLPKFAPPTNAVRDALMELGRLGGILDANDDLAAGPVALITDPTFN
jgi:hypothetical protein